MHRVRLRRAAALVLVLALQPATAAAFDPHKRITQYVFDAWDVDDGLPMNEVLQITQTPDGYIWMITGEGLVRFDGVRFKVFSVRPHGATTEYGLAAGRGGTLWLATDAGILRWDGGGVTRYSMRDGLLHDHVRCIVEGRDGEVWACTPAGLNRFQGGRITGFTTADGLPDNRVHSLVQARDGSVWLATNGGVARLHNGAFTTYTSSQARRVYEDRAGNIWIGRLDGISVLRHGQLVTYDSRDGVPAVPVSGFVEDDAGSVWIATYGGGLLRFREGRFERWTQRDGLSTDLLQSAPYLDREGSLWLGMTGGLARLRDGAITTYSSREGLRQDVIRAVLEDRHGAVWIATHGGGLSRLHHGQLTTFTRRHGLLSDAVLALHEGRSGTFWIGSYHGGLNRIEAGRIVTVATTDQLPPGDYITAILEDKTGALWLATAGGGVKRFSAGRFTSYKSNEEVTHNAVFALLENEDGSLWLGTRGGLCRLNNGRIERHTSGASVWALYRDRDDTLWAGTSDGLRRLKNGRVTRYTTAEGLFHDTIAGIVEDDDGHLWMSSNAGIFRVRKNELTAFAEGKRTAVTSDAYGVRDGMKVAECNGSTHPSAWRARDGRLWFATAKGAVVVDPRHPTLNRRAASVLLEGVIVDGHPVSHESVKELASIPPGSRQFEFQYAAPGVRDPERLRFRYRMEPGDPRWVDAGARRTAYYTNLPPGTHRFRVMAATDGSAWNEQQAAAITFSVQPFYYQTWWFYVLCAMTVSAVLWRVHRYRLDRVLEMERVRTRIASDLHDDIGSSLSQIAILSEVAHSTAAAGTGVADSLERVARLSRDSVDAMSDIVWAIDPHRDTPAHLATRMRRLASELLPTRGIELEFQAEEIGHLHVGADVRREAYLIFKEALTNVLRHAHATHVAVQLTVAAHRLILAMRDDGIGFDSTAARDGCGLGNMARRAAKIGGTLDVQSSPGQGTRVALSVPV